MKVLIIGGGAREHAIAYKLNLSEKVEKIYAIPGNAGMAEIASCLEGDILDFDYILRVIELYKIDYTVVGPEVPLCAGLVDFLEERGHEAFGPRKEAAILEGSKAYSKAFMERHNIKTAHYVEANDFDTAVNSLKEFTYPLVIKADGLAAGKGVLIVENEEEAVKSLKDLMIGNALNGSGKKVIIEEFLKGTECSLLCFVDGNTIVPMVSCRDHKQIYEGNKGPNTGGMGSVSPNPVVTKELENRIIEEVLTPFMNGLHEDNIDYRGVVFIGLMINESDINVLEFNVRFGDPETQVLMLRLESDLLDVMLACSRNELSEELVKWNDEVAMCVVLASAGYPSKYQKGKIINGLENNDLVFHAGTIWHDGNVVTNGGRVLSVCTLGKTLKEAYEKAYKKANSINFEGKYYRKDIGLC